MAKNPGQIAQGVQPFGLATTFVLLTDGGGASLLPVDEDFWSQPMVAPETSRLVSLVRSEMHWPNWEMHPKGDEVISLVSGAMTLFVETARGVESIRLNPGQTVVVPTGAWHTADVHEPGDALYITLGAGTQQRPRSD